MVRNGPTCSEESRSEECTVHTLLNIVSVPQVPQYQSALMVVSKIPWEQRKFYQMLVKANVCHFVQSNTE